MFVDEKVNGCVSIASATIGEVKTLEPMARAAKVLAAAFLSSRAGLLALLASKIQRNIENQK
jgi:hypothetical protein